MSNQFQNADRRLTVGTTFDAAGGAVFDAAVRLSQRTGMGMRAVHIVEPPALSTHVYDAILVPLAGTWGEAAAEQAQKQRSEASRSMGQLLAPAAVYASIEIDVIEASHRADALIADAKARESPLLVVGAARESYRFTPRGWSTALSLADGAPMPVLILKADRILDFRTRDVSIFIADDFSDAGLACVRAGLAFAAAVGRAQVVHANVVSGALLQRAAVASGNNGELRDMFEQRASETLRQRAAGMAAEIERSGGHYAPQVMIGDVRDEICSALLRSEPDIAVFGRHRAMHAQPLGLGRVPASAMFTGSRAVIVVPLGPDERTGPGEPAPS